MLQGWGWGGGGGGGGCHHHGDAKLSSAMWPALSPEQGVLCSVEIEGASQWEFSPK